MTKSKQANHEKCYCSIKQLATNGNCVKQRTLESSTEAQAPEEAKYRHSLIVEGKGREPAGCCQGGRERGIGMLTSYWAAALPTAP